MEKIVLAGGCFWCTEAIFKNLRGVTAATPGYAGGTRDNPAYEEVSSGETGHAEAIEVKFNPKKISLKQIMEIFFGTHDATTINRQGNDVGTQYRSAIFYTSEEQRKLAEEMKPKEAVTEIKPLKKFFKAEDYHQNYFANNQNNFYCQAVIAPKIKKLLRDYGEWVNPAT